jgi:hypothetical protein
MMSNKKITLSDSVKEQILLESDDPKCVITKLATKHGITANQIYSWRSKKRAGQIQRTTKISDNFVELVSNDLGLLPIPIAIESVQTELKFSEFSISIEGRMSINKLHKIIELVSSTC